GVHVEEQRPERHVRLDFHPDALVVGLADDELRAHPEVPQHRRVVRRKLRLGRQGDLHLPSCQVAAPSSAESFRTSSRLASSSILPSSLCSARSSTCWFHQSTLSAPSSAQRPTIC